MSGRGREIAILELHGRALYDIAQVLESAADAKTRVLSALEILRQLVPYDQCALLEAEAGFDPRVLAVPPMSPDDKSLLTERLVKLFGLFLEDRTQGSQPASIQPVGAHLAVPLIGLDKVIGVLYVRRAEGTYVTRHLQIISVVAAQLAAFLTMLRTLDAASPSDVKLDFLRMFYGDLRPPLAAALEAARVLGSKDLPEAERVRAIEVIERSIGTQTKTIDEIVEVSRYLAGKAGPEPRAVQPARTIESVIENLRPFAEQRSIRLESTVDPSVNSSAATPERLYEILTSLITIAIRFIPGGRRVEVRAAQAAGFVQFKVIEFPEGDGEQNGRVTLTVEIPLSGDGDA